MKTLLGRPGLVAVLAAVAVAGACTGDANDEDAAADEPEVTVPADATDRSFYILPPDNFEGLPTTSVSRSTGVT